MRPVLENSPRLLALLLLAACLFGDTQPAVAQDGWVSQNYAGYFQPNTPGQTAITTYIPQNEAQFSIQNVITLGLSTSFDISQFATTWTATVVVTIEAGANASSTTSSQQTLTVTYDKTPGARYNSNNYISFTGAKYVKVTLVSVNGVGFPGGYTAGMFLTVTNEMRIRRYYELPLSGSAPYTPAILSEPLVTPGTPDELPIVWQWPAGMGYTGTQLEWTWVENNLISNYTNPDGSLNFTLLFRNNATRVDLPVDLTSYRIPLFYDGPGVLYYRIRAVANKPSGNRSAGPWSGVQTYAFQGHNPNLNWQATTSFSEREKRKSVLQYYDGSLRQRQSVTKDNSNNTTISAETFYDGQGRPAIQILPAPGINTIVAYTQNLNLFNGQSPNTDPAALFDLQPLTAGNTTPPLSTASGTSFYYSAGNKETATDPVSYFLPNAAGYPYAVTRYTPDATGRVQAQSAVGSALAMGSGHEDKFYYGNASQEELDGLFGTEAGDFTHYFKNMVKDANGQMNIQYKDMNGQVIATALAGSPPAGMSSILDPAQYPGQMGTSINRNLLNTNSNLVKGDAIEAVNTLLVPVTTAYTFNYALNPASLQLPLCNSNPPVCYGCMYDLEISITDESGDLAPIVKKFDNISLSATGSCSAPVTPFRQDAFTGVPPGLSNNTVQFTETLLAGSYSVRKTLTLSGTAMNTFDSLYVNSDTTLCLKLQPIIDSVYAALLPTSDCNAAPTVTPATSQRLATIQSMMVMDMMPYTGQYAKDPSTIGSPTVVYNKYDIFSTATPGTQPFYKYPLNANGSPGVYLNDYGLADPTMNASTLTNTSAAAFYTAFIPSWANSLVEHHPEYPRLLFAQQHLAPSYDWIENFARSGTFSSALSGNFTSSTGNSENSDPFFSVATPNYKSTMSYIETVAYYNGISLWQLAYGDVVCKTITDENNLDACYGSAPKNPGLPAFTSLSAAQQDQAWNVFKGLYAAVRDSMVSDYIRVSVPLADEGALASAGYQLRIAPTFADQVVEYQWTGAPTAPGQPPTVSMPASVAAIRTSRCSSYINSWTEALQQCPAITSSPNQAAILSEITTGMELVCEKGLDEYNPYGSSGVAPGTVIDGSPRSFEDVVNSVFTKYGIARSQLCNPFVIESPKPYGKGPVFQKAMTSLVDSCTCSRFATISQNAATAGYNASSLSSLNTYLWSVYHDTLTQALFAGLQQCNLMGTQTCRDSTYQQGSPCTNPVTHKKDTCYTLASVRHCQPIVYIALSSPQPKPAFIECGYNGLNPCITCSQLSSMTSSYKTYFSGQPCAAAPVTSSASLTPDQVGYNVAFQQYVNYQTGLQLNWEEYARGANTAGCNLANYASNGSAMQTVVCPDTLPLYDTTGMFIKQPPCQRVYDMAIAIGTQLYNQRKAQLIADFKAAYRAKCLSAKSIEQFTVQYTNSEYHYTLSYYDQAGNLLKTVPPRGARPNFSASFIASVEAARVSGSTVPVPHLLTSNYRYNSLGQIIAQSTPDAGTGRLWYDRLGRMTVSQNPVQAGSNRYSYTVYDAIGRPIETGQKPQTSGMSQTISQDPAALNNWLVNTGNTREQITYTVYDAPAFTMPGLMIPKNLRNRVSAIYTKALASDLSLYAGTFYSYDMRGNVDTLVQDYLGIGAMAAADQYKRICYSYDLVSGKVTGIDYQPGSTDVFYRRFQYDAEERVVQINTSRDSITWDQDAAYSYYKYGPVASLTLGGLKVQQLRYTYTLQGWLKGVNAVNNGSSSTVDAYNYSLEYYPGDYTPINAVLKATDFFTPLGTQAAPLYNGNIAAVSLYLPGLGDTKVYNYHYDQLNRLSQMDAFSGYNSATQVFTPVQIPDYRERVTYDPNGNILKYLRNGTTSGGTPIAMDNMNYNYSSTDNKLSYIQDSVPASNYATDIDNQAAGNYSYDALGNLKADQAESITNVNWSVYGKMLEIQRTGTSVDPNTDVQFGYDGMSNRVAKIVNNNATTVYVRDAQGVVLSVYQKTGAGTMQQIENHLYGITRLGLVRQGTVAPTSVALGGSFTGTMGTFTRGEKAYELTNHLGNVLAAVSDKRLRPMINNDLFYADIISAQDYYPFGMQMPGRTYIAGSSLSYRYGFNGKENDNEVKGVGDQIDYGMRVYDPRIGKFLSVDPIAKNYPELSAYQYASNRPIDGIDQDGKEWKGFLDPINIFPEIYEGIREGQQNQRTGGSFGAGYMWGVLKVGGTRLGISAASIVVAYGAVEAAPLLQALAVNGSTWALNPANQILAISAGKIFIGFIDPSPSGELSLNLGPEGTGGYELKAAIKSIWRNAWGVTRGKAFETLAAMTKYEEWEWVGRYDRGYFPIIDFVKNKVAAQLKTFAGKVSSFSVSEYKGYINRLAKAVEKGYVSGNDRSVFVQKGQLDILIPEAYERNKGDQALQKLWTKFNEVIEYGHQRGIDVNVTHELKKE